MSMQLQQSYIFLLLHLMFIKCLNVVSPNLHLSGLKIFPATLNILSTGADVAGVARYWQANLLTQGNLLTFSCQYNKGFSDISTHGSSKYSSTSACTVLLFLEGVDGTQLCTRNCVHKGDLRPGGTKTGLVNYSWHKLLK